MSKKQKRQKIFTAVLAGILVVLTLVPMILGALEAFR